MRLLIVEDHADIVANLYGFLEPRGHGLDSARTGAAALAALARETYDAIVLDLGLPGIGGMEVCRRLRQELRLPTPVLILTARDTVTAKLEGFDSGADDYLVKPFSLAELEGRLKALVRRAQGQHVEPVLAVGELRFDTVAMTVTRAGRRIDLTPTGYRLLARLMRSAPGVVPRDELAHAVWGDSPPDSDALRTHIHTLRQAIDKGHASPMLHTVQGVGYRIEPAAAADPDED
jgi:DNA-binding response OmpR family regulator